MKIDPADSLVRTARSFFIGSVLLWLCLGDAKAQTLRGLISVERGELPIILSAPHGGRESVPGVRIRQGDGVRMFNPRSDSGTNELTRQLADAIESKTGKRPYTVIANFHRKYIDANRSKKLAYESENAQLTYEAYHRALSQARSDVLERWGSGVLFDIHGQASEPKAIFRGTQNGKTVKYLVGRYGREALIGSSSVFGQLSANGLAVIPAIDSSDREHENYDGGYIVFNYGSRVSGTVDAIQLELGSDLRASASRKTTANKVANAMVGFFKEYLPKVEQAPAESPNAALSQSTRDINGVFQDDFARGNRHGWFEMDDDASTLSVKKTDGQLGNPPMLSFTSSDKSSLKSFATHFDEVHLRNAGDFITLRFDARHNHRGFVNRGFRFGLFHSNGTRFGVDGDWDMRRVSLDDQGYFAVLDLGVSTKSDSAIIRESNNAMEERLWSGQRIASDSSDEGRDPLIFIREKNYTYHLTLTRHSQGSLDVLLKNQVSGDVRALRATSNLTPTLAFDTLYFGVNGSDADFEIDQVMVTDHQSAPAKVVSNPMRVGVYVDDGAGSSVNDLLFVLEKLDNVSIARLTAGQIRSGKLADLDLLIQPGGSGSAQGRNLGDVGRQEVRAFVQDGGGFVGICAGAYLASADYTWSLNLLDAKVVDRKHWNRGNATVDIAMTDVGKQFFRTRMKTLSIFYGQGPLLAPANRPDIEDYETLAVFDSEVAENGAPSGVMIGTTAIAKGRFGKGKVVCFSPHPEMTKGLEKMVQFAINHVKRKRSSVPR